MPFWLPGESETLPWNPDMDPYRIKTLSKKIICILNSYKPFHTVELTHLVSVVYLHFVAIFVLIAPGNSNNQYASFHPLTQKHHTTSFICIIASLIQFVSFANLALFYIRLLYPFLLESHQESATLNLCTYIHSLKRFVIFISSFSIACVVRSYFLRWWPSFVVVLLVG